MGKNKRSRSYYIQAAKRQKQSVLGADMVGFFCTCNFYERDCVREAYNILNEYADELYGKEILPEPDSEGGESQIAEVEGIKICGNVDQEKSKEDKSEDNTATSAPSDDEDGDDPLDIEAAIKADVSELQKNNEVDKKRVRRFHQSLCNAKNCVFIQTTLEDPLPLSLAIMDDILLTQKQKTKKLLRLIPVQATCKAHREDIKKAVGKLSSVYFKDSSESFCILMKVRNNTDIKNENMKIELAKIVQDASPKVSPDLYNPDVVVNINVIKNVCCLSILPHYFSKYCKYNLVQLADCKSVKKSDDVDKEKNVTVKANDEESEKTDMDCSDGKDVKGNTEKDVEKSSDDKDEKGNTEKDGEKSDDKDEKGNTEKDGEKSDEKGNTEKDGEKSSDEKEKIETGDDKNEKDGEKK